ncbi:hypothetical protein CRG98_030106, partial [Punica granatum]
MAVFRTSTSLILREVFSRPIYSSAAAIRIVPTPLSRFCPTLRSPRRGFSFSRICYAASEPADGKKASARLSQMQQLLQEAEERALSAGNEPTPKITLDHVSVSFARSGGPGGQNVNK